MTGYLLDANIVFTAFDYYPRDVFEGYWDHLERSILNGKFLFHNEIAAEINKRQDLKSDWFNTFVSREKILEPDDDELAAYAQLTKWARYEREPAYQVSAVRNFLNVGDSWMVAAAYSRGLTLLTNETSAPRKINKVKIPDAAAAFGVRCVSNLEYLRSNGIVF